MSKRKSDEPKYEVEEITKIRIGKDETGKVVTEFRVKWKNYHEQNWEKMEHVCDVPLLLKAFEKKQKANMVRGLTTAQRKNKAITEGLACFPVIPGTGLYSLFEIHI